MIQAHAERVDVGPDVRRLRNRVRDALEKAGVVMVATAGAPKVAGELLGNVRVREVDPSWGDASGLARSPPRQG
jgi:hypothetical protein